MVQKKCLWEGNIPLVLVFTFRKVVDDIRRFLKTATEIILGSKKKKTK